jgi:hypothetical protein
MTVAIFMGHSGSERGAKGIVLEDDITRQARTWAVAYARAHGVSVVTENDDKILTQRIKLANSKTLTGILEFHGNFLGSGKASGAEVWYSKSRKRAPIFATAVTKVFAKYGYKNRGAKPSSADRYGRLGILDDTNAPGLLVELFFVDSAADVARWRKNGKAYVEAITAAWLKAMGFKTSGKAVSAPAKTTSTPATKVSAKSTSITWHAQNGVFTLDRAINLRKSPSASAGMIAILSKGSKVKYNAYGYAGGYVWIRQKRSSGYGYLATGTENNGKRTGEKWGSFK